MSVLQSLFLGIMQGISEFLPVSSSGHLVVLRRVMGIGEIPLLYDIALHAATLLVVLWFFRQRIGRIALSLLRWLLRRNTPADGADLHLSMLVIVATLCTGLIGIFLRGFELHGYPKLVAGMFLLTAILLAASHFAERLSGRRQAAGAGAGAGDDIGVGAGAGAAQGARAGAGGDIGAGAWGGVAAGETAAQGAGAGAGVTALPGEDGARAGAAAPPDESGPASAAGDVPMSGWLVKGLVLGIVQGLAVIPGISRSGSTIAAALFSGIPRHRAGEVSFLLSVPAILGATLLELRHLGELTHSISLPVMAAGFLAAMISGWLSLSLLVRIIRGSKLWVFCLYLVPLGIWGLVAL